jgi:uncharacterized membrane protein
VEENHNSPQNEPMINRSAFSYYGYAWTRVWKYFLELLLVSIVSFILLLPTLGLDNENTHMFGDNFITVDLFIVSFEGFGAYLLLAISYMLLFQWPLEYGISYVHLRAARNEKIKVQNMFEAFNNYWNAVFANLLVAAIIGFGIMLLVIPGIIFACKLAFVPYLIVDKKMEAVEAVKESWRMTRGHSFTIFAMGIMAFFLVIFGLIAFIVGIVIALIWIRIAFAAIYYNASRELQPSVQNSP